MIQVDVGQLRKLELDLGELSKKAQPYAKTSALNSMAFQSQQGSRQIIRDEFTNRNAYTARSIQVERASKTRDYSLVGSTAPYVAQQEFGGNRPKAGKHGVPIPTKAAAEVPSGTGVGPRRKMVRKASRLGNVSLLQGMRGKPNRKQMNAALVNVARTKGRNKVVYLDLGKRKGLFRVTGSRKHPDIRMIYDLSHSTVHIKKHPIIWPAARFAAMKGPGFYMDALQMQIDRQKLFKSKR